jgi:4-hydroxyphenylpyruvate dioxygenase
MAYVESVGENSGENNPLHLQGIDYIEFYVGNAYMTSHFFRSAMGFATTGYCGLETGSPNKVSYVVTQGDVRLVLSSPLIPNGPLNEHLMLHGDSVKDVAFRVDDAFAAFDEAIRRGATPVQEPKVFSSEAGELVTATVQTFGDTVHTFIQRSNGKWTLPKYEQREDELCSVQAGLEGIDHVAIGLKGGELDDWVEFYERIMGFGLFHKEDIATEHSAMNSKVVAGATGRIKFPMMEPVSYHKKSQIEEYLAFHQGPGVQHIAVASNDIVSTVAALKSRGIEFLPTPGAYYDSIEARVGKTEYDIEILRELDILVDRDGSGRLYQIFTKPLQGRPTLFFEVVERRGARGFGGGNIRALFEAIEREQQRRSTL